MIYPKNCDVILDVTKAPYYCDNTGKEDCTEKLIRVMNDILSPNIKGISDALEELESSDDPNYRISFEICKKNGLINVIFPEDLQPSRIIYFPKGTYLISDTIGHTLPNLKNILNDVYTMEINRQIYIKGEDRENTIIKLADNCPGFGFGNQKPMITYMRTEQSNIAMTNSLSDITIDCGRGNEGAVGVNFYSNNSGSIRNVIFRSSDDEKRGYCGLISDGSMHAYICNVLVDGFDYAVRFKNGMHPAVFENIEIKNQRINGFVAANANVSLRHFKSINKDCPFYVSGYNSQATILDSEFIGAGDKENAGCIRFGDGIAYARNINTTNYKYPILFGGHCHDFEPYIKEKSTADGSCKLFDNDKITLGLPIEDAPEVSRVTDEKDIAYVNDFGAVADGKTDCTEAIQKAFNSGKPAVYFGSGHYLVSGSVSIPATVELVDFMYCDFYADEKLRKMKKGGFLIVEEESTNPLCLQNVFAWEKFYGYFRFIKHASQRTLIMRDLQTQCAGMYFNTVEGGKVFIENVACTMGGNEFGEDYCTISPFEFTGQRVWCRQINPERGDIQILNDHSDLWIFGMKTETHVGRFGSIAVKTINGGRTECFGASSGIGSSGIPLYINENSSVSGFFESSGFSKSTCWDIFVRETQGNETRELRQEDAIKVGRTRWSVNGYIGIKKD